MKPHTSAGCLSILVAILFSAACSQSHQSNAEYTNKSLESATQIIKDYADQELQVLRWKMEDPMDVERAKIWFPKADKINTLTTKANQDVDACFEKNSNSPCEKTKSEMIEIARKYKSDVLRVDTELAMALSRQLAVIIDSNYVGSAHSSLGCADFKNMIHCSVAIVENKTISFCNVKTAVIRGTFDEFTVLFGQNCQHFKPGDQLEITAGVGAFTRRAQPEIVIENKKIPLNESGFATFKKTITGNSGVYTVRVVVDYLMPDGTSKKVTKNIKYTID